MSDDKEYADGSARQIVVYLSKQKKIEKRKKHKIYIGVRCAYHRLEMR